MYIRITMFAHKSYVLLTLLNSVLMRRFVSSIFLPLLPLLVMAQVSHHKHLVSLIGVITRGDPLVLVVSYCEHGSLLG